MLEICFEEVGKKEAYIVHTTLADRPSRQQTDDERANKVQRYVTEIVHQKFFHPRFKWVKRLFNFESQAIKGFPHPELLLH